jgi:hypothetical protein
MQFDLGRVIEMIENRFGRPVTTGLLILVLLAIAAFCINTIGTFLVVPIYNFVATTFPGLGAPGVTVTSLLYVSAAIAAIILLAPAAYYFWKNRRIPRSVLDQLAELRKEAIQDILNGPVKSAADFDAWKVKDDDWWNRVVTYLKQHFPKYDVLSFEYIGVFNVTTFPFAFNNEHNHRLIMLSTRLARIEALIHRYATR